MHTYWLHSRYFYNINRALSLSLLFAHTIDSSRLQSWIFTKLPRRRKPHFSTITIIIKDRISFSTHGDGDSPSSSKHPSVGGGRGVRERARSDWSDPSASSKHAHFRVGKTNHPWFEQLEVVDRCGPLNLARIPCTVSTWRCGSCSGIQSILAGDAV